MSYLGQDLFGESLGNLEDIGFDAGLLQALLLSLSKSLNVAIPARIPVSL